MNLRRLLKRDSQRQLQLIETLYYSQHPLSSDELTKTIQCTTPALLSDIRSFNIAPKIHSLQNVRSDFL